MLELVCLCAPHLVLLGLLVYWWQHGYRRGEGRRIISLCVYPIKSCSGFSVSSWPVTALGFEHDREWLVYDEHRRFVTQRERPALARIRGVVDKQRNELVVTNLDARLSASISLDRWPTTPVLSIAFHEGRAPRRCVDEGDKVAAVLGGTLRLARRCVDETLNQDQQCTVLVIGTASVAELERRAGVVLGFERFRPNILVATTTPHVEDTWSTLASRALASFMLCRRCTTTTVDQQRGVRSPGGGVTPS